jgi:hypothetical protein
MMEIIFYYSLFESFLTSNFCTFTSKDASKINNYYNEDFVTQHDLLRELAIYESSQGPEGQRQRLIMDISGNTLPNWCTEQDQQFINAHLLSISTGWFIKLIPDIIGNTLPNWCTRRNPQLIDARLLSISTGWFILYLSHTRAHTQYIYIHIYI